MTDFSVSLHGTRAAQKGRHRTRVGAPHLTPLQLGAGEPGEFTHHAHRLEVQPYRPLVGRALALGRVAVAAATMATVLLFADLATPDPTATDAAQLAVTANP